MIISKYTDSRDQQMRAVGTLPRLTQEIDRREVPRPNFNILIPTGSLL